MEVSNMEGSHVKHRISKGIFLDHSGIRLI